MTNEQVLAWFICVLRCRIVAVVTSSRHHHVGRHPVIGHLSFRFRFSIVTEAELAAGVVNSHNTVVVTIVLRHLLALCGCRVIM